MINDAPELPTYYDTGPDGISEPVAVTVDPVASPPPPDDSDSVPPGALLDMILTCAGSLQEIAEHTLLLAYLTEKETPGSVPCGPRTLRDLGSKLGCSHVAAKARLNRFLRGIRENPAFLALRP